MNWKIKNENEFYNNDKYDSDFIRQVILTVKISRCLVTRELSCVKDLTGMKEVER